MCHDFRVASDFQTRDRPSAPPISSKSCGKCHCWGWPNSLAKSIPDRNFFLVPVDLNILGEQIKNMADDGAQYWVEVWNASETEKLQMFSNSRYFAVSLAAWQAAACAAGLECCLSTTTDARSWRN